VINSRFDSGSFGRFVRFLRVATAPPAPCAMLLLAIGLLLGRAPLSTAAEAPTPPPLRVAKEVFGKLPDGTEIHRYTLTNSHGLEAKVMTFGAALVGMRTPDRQGKFDDIVLHPATLEECLRGFPLAAVIGRFANRIAGARFSIDGVEYNLEANSGKHHIHGGGKKSGFAWQVWQAEPLQESGAVGVRLRLVSADGQAGFPGTLRTTVVYRLTDRNELHLEYTATTDKPTHVNLTNHAYWNLAGVDSGDTSGHVLMLNADRYLPSDEVRMPTGELLAVEGTPMDFRTPTAIGSRVDQLFRNIYDHCYVVRRSGSEQLALAARVVDPSSGRTMQVYTTQPGVQLYTGNRRGFCLETQHFPNAPNEPKFPSTLLRPGETHREVTAFEFGVQAK
jgi:aldose 1-epimerase